MSYMAKMIYATVFILIGASGCSAAFMGRIHDSLAIPVILVVILFMLILCIPEGRKDQKEYQEKVIALLTVINSKLPPSSPNELTKVSCPKCSQHVEIFASEKDQILLCKACGKSFTLN